MRRHGVKSQRKRWSRPFEDEEETELADAPDSEAPVEPDYSFEGYSVEFLEKVALMPVMRTTPARSVKA